MKHYLLIRCDYISRLIKYYDVMEIKPIFAYSGKLIKFENFQDEDLLYVESFIKDKYGTICFKGQDLDSFDIVSMLIKFKHCAFFDISSCYINKKFVDYNNNFKLTYLVFDTESG